MTNSFVQAERVQVQVQAHTRDARRGTRRAALLAGWRLAVVRSARTELTFSQPATQAEQTKKVRTPSPTARPQALTPLPAGPIHPAQKTIFPRDLQPDRLLTTPHLLRPIRRGLHHPSLYGKRVHDF